MMIEALQLWLGDCVLEIGTESGCQAAILAELVPNGQLVTVKLVRALRPRAQRVLCELGFTDMVFEPAEETLGCPARWRYGAIIVTATAPILPQSPLECLNVGGQMVIAEGPLERQELVEVLRADEAISA